MHNITDKYPAYLNIIYPPGCGGQFIRAKITEHLGIEHHYTVSANNEYLAEKFKRSKGQRKIEVLHRSKVLSENAQIYAPAIIILYNPANFKMIDILRKIKVPELTNIPQKRTRRITLNLPEVYDNPKKGSIKQLERVKRVIGKIKPSLVVEWEKLFIDLEVQPLCDFVGIEDIALFRLQCKEYHAKNMELINMYK